MLCISISKSSQREQKISFEVKNGSISTEDSAWFNKYVQITIDDANPFLEAMDKVVENL